MLWGSATKSLGDKEFQGSPAGRGRALNMRRKRAPAPIGILFQAAESCYHPETLMPDRFRAGVESVGRF
jgi:hypothetical protein